MFSSSSSSSTKGNENTVNLRKLYIHSSTLNGKGQYSSMSKLKKAQDPQDQCKNEQTSILSSMKSLKTQEKMAKVVNTLN